MLFYVALLPLFLIYVLCGIIAIILYRNYYKLRNFTSYYSYYILFLSGEILPLSLYFNQYKSRHVILCEIMTSYFLPLFLPIG